MILTFEMLVLESLRTDQTIFTVRLMDLKTDLVVASDRRLRSDTVGAGARFDELVSSLHPFLELLLY